MKRFFVIWCTLLLLCTPTISAKVIVQKEAHNFASKFFQLSPSARANNEVNFSWDSNALNPNTRSSTDDPAFYVFTRNGGKGFIIVSGEDTTYPILGYSLDEPIGDVNKLPENISSWLFQLTDAINDIRARNLSPSQEIKSMWESPAMGNIILQHETALWNQDAPYNKYAPLDEGKRSYAGCGPAAIAIVMRYHKWPQEGNGYTESYVTETKKIPVDARNLNHPYHWENMPLKFNQSTILSQIDEIATLIADIGCAFKADYAKEGTGTYTNLTALCEKFGYNSQMYKLYKEDYKSDSWEHILQKELNANRPVLYSAFTEESGHLFVLDGYTDNSYFHVNWGWGGHCNGYYRISLLSPTEEQLYSRNHSIILNFEPNKGPIGEPKDWIKFVKSGIQMPETEFKENTVYYISKVSFGNCSAIDFTGAFYGAHTDKNGLIKEIVINNLASWTIPAGSSIYYSDVPFVIYEPIEIGDKIRFLYVAESTGSVELIKPSGDNVCWEIPLTDEYSIEETTSFAYDKSKGMITLETKKGVKATLINQQLVPITQGMTQEGNTITIKTKALKPGQYVIRLQKQGEKKDILFEIKSL